MNMKIVMEPLRNSEESLKTQNLIMQRNFQCMLKFLVPYKKYVHFKKLPLTSNLRMNIIQKEQNRRRPTLFSHFKYRKDSPLPQVKSFEGLSHK